MFNRIADYIEEVRTSLRIDVSDTVYTHCMAELGSLREGRFGRVSQLLWNLRALVDELHLRLVLLEDSCLVQPGPPGHPEEPTSTKSRRSTVPVRGTVGCVSAPLRRAQRYASACPGHGTDRGRKAT